MKRKLSESTVISGLFNFIIDYRYYIALAMFILLVIFEINGSSMNRYNLMQPTSVAKELTPIFGEARANRSDEWSINTPIMASQFAGENNLGYYNDLVRGTNTEMYSIVPTPVLDILVLGTPFNIGFLFLGFSKGFAFLWNARWIALSLVSFEFFMLLTEKKRLLSFVGMIMVVLSGATQWWFSTEIVDLIIYTFLSIVLFDKFLETDKKWLKILCMFGITISAISYILCLYPAFQIPMAYVLLALIIWVISRHRGKYKLNVFDVSLMVLGIICVGLLFFRYFNLSKDVIDIVVNSSYPGKRVMLGGKENGITALFGYLYNPMMAYDHNFGLDCINASFTSLYPLPLIMGIVMLIKNRKDRNNLFFYIPMLLVSLLLSVYVIIGFSETFANITMLGKSTAARAALILGLQQIILIMYIMSHSGEEYKTIRKRHAIIIAFVSICVAIFGMSRGIYTETSLNKTEWAFLISIEIVTAIQMYLVCTAKSKLNQRFFASLTIPLMIITGIYVNPIQIGTKTLTEKPLAKEIQKIVKEDPENNMWIFDDTLIDTSGVNNYPLANGARVINSSQLYTNFELWKTLLGDKYTDEENMYNYNRYGYCRLYITNEESSVTTAYPDEIVVHVNVNDLEKLDVHYVISFADLSFYNNENIEFENIYVEDSVGIFRVNYITKK